MRISDKNIPSQLSVAGWLLIFFLLIVMISAGMTITVGYSVRPRLLGLALFAVGWIGAIAGVDGWSRVLPSIFGIATLNGIIILVGGHSLNEPLVPASRLVGAVFTFLMAVGSVVTSSLAKREITNTDRVACLGILSCFAGMLTCVMASVAHWEVPICAGLLVCLAVLVIRGSALSRRPVKMQIRP
jgi:hypothetical protein